MNPVQQKAYLDNVELLLGEVLARLRASVQLAIEGNSGQECKLRHEQTDVSKEMPLYRDFASVVTQASVVYTESQCKLADINRLYDAVEAAQETFVEQVNVMIDEISLDADSYRIGEELFFENFLEAITAVPDEDPQEAFIANAKKAVKKTIVDLCNKLDINREAFKASCQSRKHCIDKYYLSHEVQALNMQWGDYSTPAEVQQHVDMLKEELSYVDQEHLFCKVETSICDEHGEQFAPLDLLELRINIAAYVYAYSDYESEDSARFKASIESAMDNCIAHYKTKVDPGLLDYLKAAFLALSGVLVGMVLFVPAVLVTPVKNVLPAYRHWIGNTFFAGVSPQYIDSENSKIIQSHKEAHTLGDDILAWQAPVSACGN
ncbi:MAG: hypothetical protein P1U61_07180 [Legionellaceae bacterium]|nr:hypothetical protein [Legionellaceae bacterium]